MTTPRRITVPTDDDAQQSVIELRADHGGRQLVIHSEPAVRRIVRAVLDMAADSIGEHSLVDLAELSDADLGDLAADVARHMGSRLVAFDVAGPRLAEIAADLAVFAIATRHPAEREDSPR